MSFADSIRQTASIARWVSGAVMATDQTIFDRPVQADSLRGYFRPGSFGPGMGASRNAATVGKSFSGALSIRK